MVASEPMKVFLTRHRLATREAVASLATDNLLYAASVVTMVALGVVVVVSTIPLSLAWREGAYEETVPLAERLQALRQWLAWHGVRAETAVEVTTIDIADAMLSRAADLEADLLVMGAFGHRRLAERLLGGATRGLLDSMTLPVLMSH